MLMNRVFSIPELVKKMSSLNLRNNRIKKNGVEKLIPLLVSGVFVGEINIGSNYVNRMEFNDAIDDGSVFLSGLVGNGSYFAQNFSDADIINAKIMSNRDWTFLIHNFNLTFSKIA